MKYKNYISSETLRGIAELARKIKGLSSIPEEAFKSFAVARELISEIPREWFERLAEQQKKATEVFKQIDMSGVSRAIEELQKPYLKIAAQAAESLKIAKEIIIEANNILIDLGWWIYPEWPIPSLKYIVELHKEGKDQQIEKEIVEFFNDERLDEMLENWKANDKLSHRLKILEDVLWVHKQGKYTLSVPTLLPHVEGIIVEDSGKTGKVYKSEFLEALDRLVNKDVEPGSIASLFSIGALKFVDELYREGFEWGKPSEKNRPSILHGYNVEYYDEVFSLKLILLIDFIQNYINKGASLESRNLRPRKHDTTD